MSKQEELQKAIFEFISSKDVLTFENGPKELAEFVEQWMAENNPEGLE